ncbi:MAG: TIM barrel protein [Verrucomicrobiae bacterium]|nr:TIM barrel protein [Verrucomicrobiae bacterium]
MIRLGGPVFPTSDDPAELVRLHQEMGFSAAYVPPMKDAVRLKDALAALTAADILIAEVGAYNINILDTDEKRRRQNIEAIKQWLAFADEIGAACCVIHGGTVETGGWGESSAANFSKEAFEKTVAAAQAILDDVQPRRAKLAMEAGSCQLPDGPEEYLALLKAIDRPGFGVQLDPVNMISSPRRFFFNGDFLRQCFALLGPHIVCAHAKDVMLGEQEPVQLIECLAGQGQLDYRAYLLELSKLHKEPKVLPDQLTKTFQIDLKKFYARQSPPLMIAGVSGIRQCRTARDFILRVAEEVGVSIWGIEKAKA